MSKDAKITCWALLLSCFIGAASAATFRAQGVSEGARYYSGYEVTTLTNVDLNGDSVVDFKLLEDSGWGTYYSYTVFTVAPTKAAECLLEQTNQYRVAELELGHVLEGTALPGKSWGTTYAHIVPAELPPGLTNRTNVFVGFRFTAADGQHYGWCRILRELDPSTGFRVQVVDSGFQPAPGVALRVGDHPTPTPPSAGTNTVVESVDFDWDGLIDVVLSRESWTNAAAGENGLNVTLKSRNTRILMQNRVVYPCREREPIPHGMVPGLGWVLPTNSVSLLVRNATQGVESGPFAGGRERYIGVSGEVAGWVRLDTNAHVTAFSRLAGGQGTAGEVWPMEMVSTSRRRDTKKNLGFLDFDQDGLIEAFYQLTTSAYGPDNGDIVLGCSGETVRTWSIQPLVPAEFFGGFSYTDWMDSLNEGDPVRLTGGRKWLDRPSGASFRLKSEQWCGPGGMYGGNWDIYNMGVEDGVRYFALRFPIVGGWRIGWIKLNENSVLDCGMTPLGQEPIVGQKAVPDRLAIGLAGDRQTLTLTWDPFFPGYRLLSAPHLNGGVQWPPVDGAQMSSGSLLIQNGQSELGSRFFRLQRDSQ